MNTARRVALDAATVRALIELDVASDRDLGSAKIVDAIVPIGAGRSNCQYLWIDHGQAAVSTGGVTAC